MGLDFLQLITPVWAEREGVAAGGERKKQRERETLNCRELAPQEKKYGRGVLDQRTRVP